ncbi:MAG: hypothetical protein JXO22_09380 [Phycisphaerae bacterium]|nr:hypothetical protein [Phycisphaerae bacterium]
MSRITAVRWSGRMVLLGVIGVVFGCLTQVPLDGLQSEITQLIPTDDADADANAGLSAYAPPTSAAQIYASRCWMCHPNAGGLAWLADSIVADMSEVNAAMEGITLSTSEIQLLRDWLDDSAPDQDSEPGADDTDSGDDGYDDYDDVGEDEGDTSDGDAPDLPGLTTDENPPVAGNLVLGTPMNTALAITLTASDVDGDALSYALVRGCGYGTLEGTPPNLTYIPANNYVGFDSLSFTANSGRSGGTSNTANVRIWVIDEQDLAGQTVSGTIDPSSDMEAWSFDCVAGQRGLITVAAGGFSPIMSLYPPNSGSAEIGGSLGYTRFDHQFLNTGQYTVLVESFMHASTGGFNLTVVQLQGQIASLADLDGGPIASGQSLSARLNSTSDMDAFTFEGVAGQRVLITVAAAGFSPIMSLYPPNGGPAEFGGGLGKTRIDQQLQATGRYNIIIESFMHASTGQYTVTLQQF